MMLCKQQEQCGHEISLDPSRVMGTQYLIDLFIGN